MVQTTKGRLCATLRMLAVSASALMVGAIVLAPLAQICSDETSDNPEAATLELVLGGRTPADRYPLRISDIGRLTKFLSVASVCPAHRGGEFPGLGMLPIYLYCDASKPKKVGVEYVLDGSVDIQVTEAVAVISECVPSGHEISIGRALVCLQSGAWHAADDSSGDCGRGPQAIVTQSLADLPGEFRASYGAAAGDLLNRLATTLSDNAQLWIAYERINMNPPSYAERISHRLRVFRAPARAPWSSITQEAEKFFGAQPVFAE